MSSRPKRPKISEVKMYDILYSSNNGEDYVILAESNSKYELISLFTSLMKGKKYTGRSLDILVFDFHSGKQISIDSNIYILRETI